MIRQCLIINVKINFGLCRINKVNSILLKNTTKNVLGVHILSISWCMHVQKWNNFYSFIFKLPLHNTELKWPLIPAANWKLTLNTDMTNAIATVIKEYIRLQRDYIFRFRMLGKGCCCSWKVWLSISTVWHTVRLHETVVQVFGTRPCGNIWESNWYSKYAGGMKSTLLVYSGIDIMKFSMCCIGYHYIFSLHKNCGRSSSLSGNKGLMVGILQNWTHIT